MDAQPPGKPKRRTTGTGNRLKDELRGMLSKKKWCLCSHMLDMLLGDYHVEGVEVVYFSAGK
jgi:hypothetical protein